LRLGRLVFEVQLQLWCSIQTEKSEKSSWLEQEGAVQSSHRECFAVRVPVAKKSAFAFVNLLAPNASAYRSKLHKMHSPHLPRGWGF
jgi:hypothetical protein